MKETDYKEMTDYIKRRIDIKDEIGQRVKLNKYNKAICPFHRDIKPSLSVNTRKGYFCCFGCGVGGDVIKFIMLYEGRSFWETVSYLAKKIQIDLNNGGLKNGR